MGQRVKTRTYDASRRREAAARTRRSIEAAAGRLFVEQGFAPTTMAAIAEAAGVAIDTVYATVGPKPELLRLLVETAISGVDIPVAAEERDYVRAIQAEADPSRKLDLYAAAMRRIHRRLAPMFLVLREAAPTDPSLRALWREIADRRARNMRKLATELKSAGGLRPDLTVAEAADIIWATNSPEMFVLLVHERGWSPMRYQRWLADTWRRLLLP